MNPNASEIDEETHAGSAGGASSPALQYPPTSSGLDSDMNDVVSTTNGGITRPNRHPSSNVNLRNPFSADVSQSQSGRDPLSSQISAIGPNTSSGGNALNLLLMHDQQTPPLTMTDFPSSLGSSNAILHDQGTPHHQGRFMRHDIGAPQRAISLMPSSDPRELFADPLLSSLGGGHQEENIISGGDKVRVIWGTNIVIQETVKQFKDFLLNFTEAHLVLANGGMANDEANLWEPYYPKLLKRLYETGQNYMNLDGRHLKAFRGTRILFDQLIKYPQEIIPLMDLTVNEVFSNLAGSVNLNNNLTMLQVRPFQMDRHVNLREMSPSEVDQLITLKGLVIRSTSILPDMRTGFFQCSQCAHVMTVDNIKGVLAEPQACPRIGCGAHHSMVLVHNRSVFSDKQLVRIQETPDMVPDGQTPHVVTLCVYDQLVDRVRPGDRIQVTGIYRVAPVRLNHRMRRVKNVFRTYIDAVHIEVEGDLTSGDEINDDAIRNESNLRLNDTTRDIHTDGAVCSQVEEEIIKLSKEPQLYERLAHSVAPSIWQQETVKKGLLLQLFGGVTKTLRQHGDTTFRGDIHVLLAGDPSVSKSQLLQYAHQLAPRGLYTSGKGSSAVGLTAYITRDPETHSLVLESGALVLSDGGLCCIDEFDKMSDSTRAILHEAMEQQTISISKAGIITTLHARTSVLAAANPIESKYNPRRSIVENLHLPPSLISRFDLICLMLDVPNEEMDMQLAKHILSLHVREENLEGQKSLGFTTSHGSGAPVDPKLLGKYIAYARKHCTPVLSEEAIRPLLDGYVAMRKVNQTTTSSATTNAPMSSGGGTNNATSKTVSATTRQLESLVRLSEAHARMRLSPFVEPQDVEEAIRLVKAAILSYALDPLTGKIDMDLISTGKGASFRNTLAHWKQCLTSVLMARPINAVPLTIGQLARELVNYQKNAVVSTSSFGSNASLPDSLMKQLLSDCVDEDIIQLNGPIRSTTIVSLSRK